MNVDSNDVEQMLNLYERSLEQCRFPLTRRAKQDSVVEIRKLFRSLVDATMRNKPTLYHLSPDDQILEA